MERTNFIVSLRKNRVFFGIVLIFGRVDWIRYNWKWTHFFCCWTEYLRVCGECWWEKKPLPFAIFFFGFVNFFFRQFIRVVNFHVSHSFESKSSLKKSFYKKKGNWISSDQNERREQFFLRNSMEIEQNNRNWNVSRFGIAPPIFTLFRII